MWIAGQRCWDGAEYWNLDGSCSGVEMWSRSGLFAAGFGMRSCVGCLKCWVLLHVGIYWALLRAMQS